ncbi:MAG: DNA repair protein RadA [Elusimicrobiota bacterium]
MPKLKSIYICQECGQSTTKWAGQCPACRAWNTLVEEVVEERPAAAVKSAPRPLTDFTSETVPLADVQAAEAARTPTRLSELDRLLGGGLVPGHVLLLAGAPGIGKSTLMLHAAGSLAAAGKVLYVSGEESLSQVSGRAKRLGLRGEGIYLLAETDLVKILDAIRKHEPRFIVIDSVQTVYHPELGGGPGSVGQVRECAAELLRAVKQRDAALFLLGHVTKEGSVAGPKVLEHIVDTVLQFDTEKHHQLRVLRAQKNRFGPTSEIGIFEMREDGLHGVTDASAFFIEELDRAPVPGRAISVAVEGSRPMLVEVQALVSPTRYPLPRRMATGIDVNRVLVLVAALEKHLAVRFENQDIFVNLAGGVRLRDPAIDLAVCLALVSSAREAALPSDQVYIGEVGLLGGLGRVAFLTERLQAAERVGFKSAVIPSRSRKDLAGGKRKLRLVLQEADDMVAAVGRVLKI